MIVNKQKGYIGHVRKTALTKSPEILAGRYFRCDADCVEAWLSRSGQRKGPVFDLGTLCDLAAHWYVGHRTA
jgi:hypothetical protein